MRLILIGNPNRETPSPLRILVGGRFMLPIQPKGIGKRLDR